jgi:ribosome biogenesis GTPase
MSRGARRDRSTENVSPSALHDGLVLTSLRRHFAVLLDSGEHVQCVLKGRSMTLACGDRVQVARTDGGGVIVAILPRLTLFYRSDAFREKLIAANVTQIVGVVAPDIGVDEELINRWIIAAEAERCRLVLVANKADARFDTLLARLACTPQQLSGRTPFHQTGYRPLLRRAVNALN